MGGSGLCRVMATNGGMQPLGAFVEGRNYKHGSVRCVWWGVEERMVARDVKVANWVTSWVDEKRGMRVGVWRVKKDRITISGCVA